MITTQDDTFDRYRIIVGADPENPIRPATMLSAAPLVHAGIVVPAQFAPYPAA